MSKLYESGENYLETILILRNRNSEVRSIDIAHEMDLSKPSVSRAMGILKDGKFISIDNNGYITLTDAGEEVAQNIYEKHRILSDWLISLGVNKDIAIEDACKIEHDISNESFQKLKDHIQLNHKMQ